MPDIIFTTDLFGVQHWATWHVGNRAATTGAEFTPRQGPGRVVFDEVTHDTRDPKDPSAGPTVHAHNYTGPTGTRVDYTLPIVALETAVIHRKKELQL